MVQELQTGDHVVFNQDGNVVAATVVTSGTDLVWLITADGEKRVLYRAALTFVRHGQRNGYTEKSI